MQNLTQDELGKILGISRPAVHALASRGLMPYKEKLPAGQYCFCLGEITKWMQQGFDLTANENLIEESRNRFLAEFPEQMRKIREFGKNFSEPPKYYYLKAEPSKKLGRTWYVRYLDKGKLVPNKWSTGTNDRKAAEAWATENRERLLAAHYGRLENPRLDLYGTLKRYYEKDSPFLETDIERGRTLGEKKRQIYDGFIKNKFIPFARKKGAMNVTDITTPLLTLFQNHLRKTLRPQTVNHYMCAVKTIFDHLVIHGYAGLNPCTALTALGVKDSDTRATGCYELQKLKGVFNKKWKDDTNYLLCLLMHATNMRNSEIRRLQTSDIVEIGGEKFIHIPKSKTPSGERRVPLHPIVYEKLMDYAGDGDYAFSRSGRTFDRDCANAKLELAGHLGYTPEMLEKENIRFYSGRHFWKTLMSSESLGENIEKVFMGHKVSGNVADTYNHRDRVGAENLARKAREVFAVLDRCLFDSTPAPPGFPPGERFARNL